MTGERAGEVDGHDGWTFDLTTPRQYTARGGWNASCVCGALIGESGDGDLAERHARHVALITPRPPGTHPGPRPMTGQVYIDTADWWIGYYRGPNHHYVCPLPTVVIRWRRRHTQPTRDRDR